MLRPFSALLCILTLANCGNGIKNKEKVHEAILNRLQTHSGLDLKSLDVTTTAVSFDKNMAYATVAFHPKDETAVNSGMVMKYTLEEQGGKWVIVNVGDSQGHGLAAHSAAPGGDQLPPGHPPVTSTDPHARPLDQGAGGRAQ